MPVAASRLTGSVTGFHDPSLVSVMGGDSGRAQSPAPSMARERLWWAPWTGPTNGWRVSRVMSYPCTSPTRSAVPDDAQTLRCLALLPADRPGHAHAQPALVDLVGRVPGAPPENSNNHATRGVRDGVTGGGHRASGVTPPPLPVGRARTGRCGGGGEAEGCRRRGDGARSHLDRPVASRLADWAGRPPGAGAWPLCRRRRASPLGARWMNESEEMFRDGHRAVSEPG